MPYAFGADETIQDGVIRIAREQISRAIDEIEDDDLTPHATVHQVRKRCKKLRGLLRIVRPSLTGRSYARENTGFRDAARALSSVRDAHTLVECTDDLLARFRSQVDPALGSELRTRLIERRRRVTNELLTGAHLESVHEMLQAAHARAGAWRVKKDGFPALASGLKKTYKRGRDAMQAATDKRSDARLHQWRKRAKYHGYHLRLLKRSWKGVLKHHAKAADELADRLGDDHDLAVLRAALVSAPADYGATQDLETLLGLIDRRRVDLQESAFLLGERIYADKPGALVRRLEACWAAWEQEQSLTSSAMPVAASA